MKKTQKIKTLRKLRALRRQGKRIYFKSSDGINSSRAWTYMGAWELITSRGNVDYSVSDGFIDGLNVDFYIEEAQKIIEYIYL